MVLCINLTNQRVPELYRIYAYPPQSYSYESALLDPVGTYGHIYISGTCNHFQSCKELARV